VSICGSNSDVFRSTIVNTRFVLPQSEIPTHWYNLAADFPEPMAPPLHPGTRQPIQPQEMAAIFPENIVAQEMSTERHIEIPQEVRDIYALWRPTPLLRAVRLEKQLQTPAHIYYKFEGASPAGSHKPNSAVPQAYYNRLAGTKRLATETGAGQWGSSLALACRLMGIECVVYMVKVSFHHKPYRKMLMQTWGATVHASPSEQTEYGRRTLAADPENPGSLGIAISEAIEDTLRTPNTKYALGSVLNHVCLHQTVIGQESIRQMELAGEEPDVVIGCVGGGSNFAGIAFPFIERKIKQGRKTRILAVEPSVCASLTKGELRYDFGDTAGTTPLMLMHTLGHDFIPPSIHAGGLRYHGMAPMVSHAFTLGLIEARAYPQTQVFEAATAFARTEGIIPAPESSHAVRAAIDEAIDAREAGQKRTILFNLSGHGLMDMTAYDAFLAGRLQEL
jgi:tryptophan synthase beta chain